MWCRGGRRAFKKPVKLKMGFISELHRIHHECALIWCRGEVEEGQGREAIQALNIALTQTQKRSNDTYSIGNGFYKITPMTASSLGKGVLVHFIPPLPPPFCLFASQM